eukprot:TRINITY_DN48822_c0_g1_i1.p2 TRINITY_DN48822_c0_g1~~TRINITY_DN48822_c0_g1_i1.p2  ORF type:complete len:197 (+),score=25.60 TRINITY_DN48822_c0_g1_i1:34-591(+)
MKAFIVLLAVAYAAAEADPQWIYNSPMVAPLTYNTVVKPIEYKPVEYKTVEYKFPEIKPVEYKAPEVKPVQYVVKPYAAMPTVYNQYNPYMYTMPYLMPQVKTYSDDSKSEMEYAGKGTYYAESAGAIHKAKREAEADPALIYSGYYPTTYNYKPAVYSNAWGYNTPLTYNAAWTMPYAYNQWYY